MSEDIFKGVTLRAEAKNTETALVISYTVENQTDGVLYLWDAMIGWEGFTQKIDHDGAYVFFEEPSTVRVIRASLPLPELRQVGRKEIPFTRLLEPKSSLTGKITLRHPVREYSPYYEPMKEDEQELKKCSRVRLLIGWTPPKPGMRIDERIVGGEKVYAIRGGWEAPYQNVLEEMLPVNVDLLTYTTTFERQMPLQ
ncbi:MAG TPA: hypothetical protein VEV84_04265 [Pyrinomonadaceae bacterium]|nr:hypothetical protein [Pyrinomonadaceae bacterium]